MNSNNYSVVGSYLTTTAPNGILFNDDVYGGDQILKGTTFKKYQQFVKNSFKKMPRQALHAKTLEFEHPTKKKRMKFNSDLPEDLEQF